MQTAGAGCEAAVRISAGGAARAEESGVGARAGGDGGVSEIAGDAGEHGVGWRSFLAWKIRAGGGSLTELAAREADAFLILEKEWREAKRMANQLRSNC